MTLEIMTPESPRWELFSSLLSDALLDEMPENTHRCGNDDGSGPSHHYTKIVLTELGGIDVAATLKFFQERGGYCDCEVMFNVVAPSFPNEVSVQYEEVQITP